VNSRSQFLPIRTINIQSNDIHLLFHLSFPFTGNGTKQISDKYRFPFNADSVSSRVFCTIRY
jgi:hypothetical protein